MIGSEPDPVMGFLSNSFLMGLENVVLMYITNIQEMAELFAGHFYIVRNVKDDLKS